MLLISVALVAAWLAAEGPQIHYIVWDSPSHDARGSMPIGNGDIGGGRQVSFRVDANHPAVFVAFRSALARSQLPHRNREPA
jgi:hypothetical protein